MDRQLSTCSYIPSQLFRYSCATCQRDQLSRNATEAGSREDSFSRVNGTVDWPYSSVHRDTCERSIGKTRPQDPRPDAREGCEGMDLRCSIKPPLPHRSATRRPVLLVESGHRINKKADHLWASMVPPPNFGLWGTLRLPNVGAWPSEVYRTRSALPAAFRHSQSRE